MTDKQQVRHLRKYLGDLTIGVASFLTQVDANMKLPSTEARGRRIAALCNLLEMANDSASHFGLGKSLKKKGIGGRP